MIETVLFGSIGVLAETSDIQRRAYNQAMVEAGIDWSWDRDTYRRLLTISGGQARLRLLADATNAQLSEDQIVGIHRRKTEIACSEISESKTPLRPGVAELVRWALGADKTLGLVTSTYRPNIDAIAKAAGSELSLDNFAVVLTTDDVARGKPAPDVYKVALELTGADPATTIAIEDTPMSVLAALTAGLRVIAVPGELSGGQPIAGAECVVDALADGSGMRPEVTSIIGL